MNILRAALFTLDSNLTPPPVMCLDDNYTLADHGLSCGFNICDSYWTVVDASQRKEQKDTKQVENHTGF